MKTQFVAASFLALFLELTFIRWLPDNVMSLAYDTNIVLLSSFLGFVLADRPREHLGYFPAVLLGVTVIAVLFRSVDTVVPSVSNELL